MESVQGRRGIQTDKSALPVRSLMARFRNGSYAVGLITVIFAMTVFPGCEGCPDSEFDPDKKWVTCINDVPVLTNGKMNFNTGAGFNPAQWRCPKDTTSPVYTGPGRSVYPRHVPSNSVNLPASVPTAKDAKAAVSTGVAYLLPQVLDLPFKALPSASDKGAPCDSSYPDVIQVNHENASVNRISGCSLQFLATVPVVTRPLQIAITPDGLTALVTSFDNAINFIDLTTNKVTFTLQTAFDVNPHGIAITSDGSKAYIASFNSDNPMVQVIDLTSKKVTASIFVNAYPQSLYLTPDESQLYVNFPFGGAVFIIDTLSNTVANTLSIQVPRGIAFNSKGTRAYISSASGTVGTIQQLNMTTFKVDKVYNVGAGPTDVEVLYGDRFVVVNNYEGHSISLIDVITGTVQTTSVNGSPSGIYVVR